MKATDLMIGDWVIEKDRVCRVSFNTIIEEVRKEDCATSASSSTRYYDIEPITLTTEILEKNGFVKVPDRYEYPDCQCWTNDVDGDYSFEIVADKHRKPHILGNREMGDYELVNFECKFVHELQHTLKLCKIEKEIVL